MCTARSPRGRFLQKPVWKKIVSCSPVSRSPSPDDRHPLAHSTIGCSPALLHIFLCVAFVLLQIRLSSTVRNNAQTVHLCHTQRFIYIQYIFCRAIETRLKFYGVEPKKQLSIPFLVIFLLKQNICLIWRKKNYLLSIVWIFSLNQALRYHWPGGTRKVIPVKYIIIQMSCEYHLVSGR